MASARCRRPSTPPRPSAAAATCPRRAGGTPASSAQRRQTVRHSQTHPHRWPLMRVSDWPPSMMKCLSPSVLQTHLHTCTHLHLWRCDVSLTVTLTGLSLILSHTHICIIDSEASLALSLSRAHSLTLSQTITGTSLPLTQRLLCHSATQTHLHYWYRFISLSPSLSNPHRDIHTVYTIDTYSSWCQPFSLSEHDFNLQSFRVLSIFYCHYCLHRAL